MELEQLLQLCQAYGVTSFKNKEYDLELVNLGGSVVDDDETDFEIEVSKMEVLESN